MPVNEYKKSGKREFEKIYSRLFDFYFQIAFHFLNNSEDAKEVVQDAFIKLWENSVYRKDILEIKNYLFIVIRNRCLNMLRDKKKMIQEDNYERRIASLSYKLLEETSEDILLYRELSEKVQEAISSLPPKCGQVFKLSRTEDLSNKEIAQKLNISLKSVEANITRALKSLRIELAPYLAQKKKSGNDFIFNILISLL